MRQTGEKAQDGALGEALRLARARWSDAASDRPGADEAQGFAALRATLADLCAGTNALMRWPDGGAPAVALSPVPEGGAPDHLWASHPLGPDHTLDLGDPQFFLCLDSAGLEIGLIARTEDAAVREHRVQRMLKRRMPGVFRSVRRVLKTPRLRGSEGARWALRWRQALDAPRERAPDVNQWLAQQVSKTDHRRLCLSCLYRFDDLDGIDLAEAARDALLTLAPLISPAVAPATGAAANAEKTPARDLATLLASGAPRDALRDWAARALAAAGQEGLDLVPQEDSDGALWLWISGGTRANDAHPGYCGLHLDPGSGRLALTLYQGISYGVSRFGGRGSVAEMQRRRAGLLPCFHALEAEGFALDSRLHQTGETERRILHEAALTAWCETAVEEADAPRTLTRLAAMLAARDAVARAVADY